MKCSYHDDVVLVSLWVVPYQRISFHAHTQIKGHDHILLSNFKWCFLWKLQTFLHRLVVSDREWGEREMFYLTTHSTHFIYGYMASDIWLRTILIVRKETRCRHIGYSYRLTARVLLYAPSHRQDDTYHGLCYTSRGALAGTRNSDREWNHRVVVKWSADEEHPQWRTQYPVHPGMVCSGVAQWSRNSSHSMFFITKFYCAFSVPSMAFRFISYSGLHRFPT